MIFPKTGSHFSGSCPNGGGSDGPIGNIEGRSLLPCTAPPYSDALLPAQCLDLLETCCDVAHDCNDVYNTAIVLKRDGREFDRDLRSIFTARRHRQEVAFWIAALSSCDHFAESLPVPRSKPLRDNDVERVADCLPRVESEDAAGTQIPETNDAVGIAGDDGVACGVKDSIRNTPAQDCGEIRLIGQVHLDLTNYFSVISDAWRAPTVRSVSFPIGNKPTHRAQLNTQILLFVPLFMRNLPGFASINSPTDRARFSFEKSRPAATRSATTKRVRKASRCEASIPSSCRAFNSPG